MSEDHPHHPQSAETATDQWAQDAQDFRRILLELIDMGADMARRVHRQSQSPAEAPQPVSDLASEQTIDPSSSAPIVAPTQEQIIAFDRITRCIRRTMSLVRRLAEPINAPTAPAFRAPHHMAARKRNIRVVDDNFQPNQAQDDLANCSDAELQDRLEELDLDDDVTDRPIADITADICRDLGIAHLPDAYPHKRRIVADIANLARRAAIFIPLKSQPSHASPDRTAPNQVVAMHAHQRTAGDKSTDPP